MLRIGWKIKATADKSHVILKKSDAKIHEIKPFANKSMKIPNLMNYPKPRKQSRGRKLCPKSIHIS